MFKGYDNVDTFDIFSKFIDRYSKILSKFKENHCGYPAHLTEKEWEEILNEMLYHLYYMNEDNVEKELTREVPENWIPSGKTIGSITCAHKDRFFELFSEFFYDLWD